MYSEQFAMLARKIM